MRKQLLTISEKEDLRLINYLRGNLFSNNEKFYFPAKDFIYNRVKFLLELLTNKSVLHMGCCDHVEIIHKKIIEKTHLHTQISQVTDHCIGIDIDTDAIQLLNNLGYTNCFFYDIFESQNSKLEQEHYDYVLLGELLEHIVNPISFLKEVRKKFINAKRIIITVPNAFSSKNFYNMQKGVEEINTDHKFWFTPYTLSKIVTEAGFQAESIFYVDRSRITSFDKILKWVYFFMGKDVFSGRKWKTYKSNGIVMIASF